jgi:hypothetical protein
VTIRTSRAFTNTGHVAIKDAYRLLHLLIGYYTCLYLVA